MPCESHDEINLKKPCQPGYEQYGMKMKDGKKVPNCIPLKTDLELEEMAVKLSEYGVDEETLLE